MARRLDRFAPVNRPGGVIEANPKARYPTRRCRECGEER